MTIDQYDELLEPYAAKIASKCLSGRMDPFKADRLLTKLGEWYERYEELVDNGQTESQ